MDPKLHKALKTIPLFTGISERLMDDIVSLTSTKKQAKNTIVVQEGNMGDTMYVILQGSVKISYYARDGREVVLSIMQPGEFFGEMSLLDEQPRSATVVTLIDSEFATLHGIAFRRLMEKSHELTYQMLTEVVQRLRLTSKVLERISTMDVPHRLYDFLTYYCKRYGHVLPSGQYATKLPTHQLLADQLSTSRETISRAISALKKESILITDGGRGKVLVDMEALETLMLALR
ncbi:MAG: Crp/Fnr family transcriptional regulator [Mariprofundales bacterium]